MHDLRHEMNDLNVDMFLNGPFPASFFFIFVFSIQLILNK